MNEQKIDFKAIVEETQDVIIVTKAIPLDEPGPEIVYVNKAFTKLTGYRADEAIGKNPRFLQSADTDKKTSHDIRQALEQKKPVRVTIKNHTKTGDEYWLDLRILPLKNESGETTHFMAIEQDLSEQQQLKIRVDELSKNDFLTGLLNRRAFDEIIILEFLRFSRTYKSYSILMVDIDSLKSINDKFGHAAGDQVLENFTNVFELVLRPYDRAARTGGKEFCILLADTGLDKAIKTAERLRKSVEKTPFSITDDSIKVTVSIGVSEVLQNDTDYSDIIQRANKAMYSASENGRNQVQKYHLQTTATN